MILPIILLFFIGIFNFLSLKKTNYNQEPYLKDFITSISSQVRTFGTQKQINLINAGISETFFINTYKIHKENFETYPLDLYYTIAYLNPKIYPFFEESEPKLIFALKENKLLFKINSKNLTIAITKEILLANANIKEYIVQHHFNLFKEEEPFLNYKQLIKYNII